MHPVDICVENEDGHLYDANRNGNRSESGCKSQHCIYLLHTTHVHQRRRQDDKSTIALLAPRAGFKRAITGMTCAITERPVQ